MNASWPTCAPSRAVVLALLLVVPACQSTEAGAPEAGRGAAEGWLAHRGRDLAAIFDASVTLGPGLGARVGATRHVQAGFVLLGPTATSRQLPTRAIAFGKRGDQIGAWQIEDAEYGLSPWYVGHATLERTDGGGDGAKFDGDLATTRGTQFSLQLHLALIGADVAFDPMALARFFVGLFGDPEPAPAAEEGAPKN